MPKAVERIAGLQAQLPSTPYVGLWSRLEGFRPVALERALKARKVVRGVLMRGTVHLVTTSDYGLFAKGIEAAPAGWVKPEADELARAIAAPLRAFCAEPRTREEVLDWLEREHGVASDGTTASGTRCGCTAGSATRPRRASGVAPIHGPTFVAIEHDDPTPTRRELSSSAATSPRSGRRRAPRSPAGRV